MEIGEIVWFYFELVNMMVEKKYIKDSNSR